LERASGLRFALLLVGLAALAILVACNGDEDDTAPGPTAEGTAVSATDTPEGTPLPTSSGELSISFTAECGGDEEAPELTVAIQATASDDAVIDKVRVFVDGIQGLERETDSAKEFDETVSLAATPGAHGVRVSAEGDGLQTVSQPEEVTCPGTAEAEEE
jgi:hypothetical protein